MRRPEAFAAAPLAQSDGEPVFDEPWQAQLLAVAYALAERGVFSPADWSNALGTELRRAEAAGAADSKSTYYAAALCALERLVADAGQVTAEDIKHRTQEWRAAYRRTPHGRPVEL